jgi:hypothetical protein
VQPQTAGDAARPAAAERRSDGTRAFRAASIVSYVLNPLVFSPIGFALIHAHFGARWTDVAATFGVSLAFFCLAPLAYLLWMVRHGEAATLEVRDRRLRARPLLVGMACYVAGTLALSATLDGPARPVVLAYAALFPLNTAAILLVTLRFKMSIHMTSLAGFVVGLLFVALAPWPHVPAGTVLRLPPELALALAPLIPLLAWARVRSRAHTPAEVAVGTAFGLVVPILELAAIFHLLPGSG